ncbi:MAG: hypothetical protein IIC29_08295 [Chloroflexi bacterium]|nr:hypothetical protein [Chloroflexota bacterium]
MTSDTRIPPALYVAAGAAGLIGLGLVGYLGFLAFVQAGLDDAQFAGYGLVLTAVVAATASFFSPCSFTVLPGYLAFAAGGTDDTGASGGAAGLRGALRNGLAAAAGVVTVVALLGLLIALLGTGIGADLSITGDNPSAGAKALRIGIGAFVLTMGVVHILDLTHRLRLLSKVSVWAIEHEGDSRSLRGLYGYGAGYVLVGVG